MDKELRMEPGDTHMKRDIAESDEAIDFDQRWDRAHTEGRAEVQRERESELKAL